MASTGRVLRSATAAASAAAEDTVEPMSLDQEEPGRNEEVNVEVTETTETGETQVAIQGVTNQMSQVNIAEEASGEEAEPRQNNNEFTDMHRLILQGMMAAGFLDAKGVKKLFQEAHRCTNSTFSLSEIITPPFIQRIVREINEKIRIFDMMIRSATCEISGEKFYMFLVTMEKVVMKYQTFFRKFELKFLHKLMHHIINESHSFSMSMTEALNIMGDDVDSKKFSKTHAEHFIQRMIVMQYLTRLPSSDEDYDITLGFRTIREFEPMFTEEYGECFTKCCLCKLILLNGLQCPKCPAVIHRGCLNKYLQESKICASCNAVWRRKALVVRTRDSGEIPSTSTQALASTQPPLPASGTVVEPVPKRTRMVEQLQQPFDIEVQPSTAETVNTVEEYGDAGADVDMPILEPMTPPRSSRKRSPQPSTSKEAIEKMKSTRSSRRMKPIPTFESASSESSE